MDDQRFDNVAKALGGGTTRRGVFRVLAAGAAAGFGAMTGAEAKAAPGGGKGKPPCCPAGYDALCPVVGRPTCTNTRTDASNCGVCGTSCPSGVCTNGVCGPTCTPGSAGASCTVGIGACQRTGTLICKPDGSGYVCDAVPGNPQPETCNDIDDDCNGIIDDGFNLLADVNHCGECNNQCQIPNATPICANGTCRISNCDAGYADCDGRVDNGCETNINDVSSCGSCGKVCDAPRENGTVACVNMNCVVTCEDGYHLAGTTNQPECVPGTSCDDTNNGGCHPVATCTDTAEGPSCQCPAGYSGNGVGGDGCIDIDECLTNNGGCSSNAFCTNTEGGRACTCNPGFTGDGVTCAPVVPRLVSVSVDPNPLSLGDTGIGTVTLDAAAIANTTVMVSSSNGDLFVDATATVPVGQTSGTFGVQWMAGDVGSVATVSATLGDQTVTTAVGFAL